MMSQLFRGLFYQEEAFLVQHLHDRHLLFLCQALNILSRGQNRFLHHLFQKLVDISHKKFLRPLRLASRLLATGPVFEIEDCREAVRGKARTTGELAHRYVVKIQGKETYLYETSGRWFVEMKE